MKTLSAVFAFVSLFACRVQADDSFFSADGKTVTFAPLARPGLLLRLDVATGKVKELPLPAELKNEEVGSVARGAGGETLFLAGPAVWVMKEDGKAKRVVDLKPLKKAYDLCVVTKPGSPLLDWLFVSGSERRMPRKVCFTPASPEAPGSRRSSAAA